MDQIKNAAPSPLTRYRAFVSAIIAIALVLTGCSPFSSDKGSGGQPGQPPPLPHAETPVPTPSAPPGLYPPDFRTQNPALDPVIDAFQQKDVDRLMGLVAMTTRKCGSGTPFYCGDSPEGTEKGYFARATCNVNYLIDPQMIRGDLAMWVEESRFFYAAYSVQGMAPDAYYLIFARGLDDPSAKTATLNANGKIILLGLGCTVPTMPLSGEHYKPLVPPKSN